MFNGFIGTTIAYDAENKVWRISVRHKPYATATSKADFETLILGNHEWEIHDDVGCFDGTELKS